MQPNIQIPDTNTPTLTLNPCPHGYARGHTLHTLPTRLAYKETPDNWQDIDRIEIDPTTGWCTADSIDFFNHTPRAIIHAHNGPGPFLARINTRFRLLTISSAATAAAWAFSIALTEDNPNQNLCH